MSTPASIAAMCGAIAGANAYGLTSEYRARTLIASVSARASALRSPAAVRVQPEATGFIAATLAPRARNAPQRATAVRVLPIPVSVPVTNRVAVVTAGAESAIGA